MLGFILLLPRGSSDLHLEINGKTLALRLLQYHCLQLGVNSMNVQIAVLQYSLYYEV